MFTVPVLTGGGVGFTSQANTTFTTTGVFNFLIELSPAPFSAVVVQAGETPVQVTFIVAATSAVNCPTETRGPGSCVVVSDTAGCFVYDDENECISNNPHPAPPVNPEVRFDICSPFIGDPSCSTISPQPRQDDTGPGQGRFGVPFNGTLGDFFRTVIVLQPVPSDPPTATPSIYFLQSPRDEVSGVFRSNDGTLLIGQLYINGESRQIDAGFSGEDVVLNSDL